MLNYQRVKHRCCDELKKITAARHLMSRKSMIAASREMPTT
jgi:hypothetical protein